MCFKVINRVLLGLLMLVPGLLKLFVFKPAGVTQMLTGFGFPAPLFFAWVLIILEIVSGLAILANFRIRMVTWVPVIILLVATILTTFADLQNANIPGILLHLVAISNYLLLWEWAGRDRGMRHSTKR